MSKQNLMLLIKQQSKKMKREIYGNLSHSEDSDDLSMTREQEHAMILNKVGFMSKQLDQRVLCDEMYPSRINYHDLTQYKKVLSSQNQITEQARKKVREQLK